MPDTEPTTPPLGPPALPGQFFDWSNLYTLAGSAGAVWLCCAVISSVVAKGFFTPQQWRLIALFLSELLTFSFLFTSANRTYQNSILALLNGCLVFINASGINAVTSGLSFQSPEKTTSIKAALFPFTNEIDWWPSAELLAQNEKLRQDTTALRNSLKKCDTTELRDSLKQSEGQQKKYLFERDSIFSLLKSSRQTSGPTTHSHNGAKHPPSSSNARPSAATPTRPTDLKQVDTLSASLIAKWMTSRLTITERLTRVVEAPGSGCTFKLTLDSVRAIFSEQRNNFLPSEILFSTEERSLSCHIPLTSPSRRQAFSLNQGEVNADGRVHATYSDISDNPGFYQVSIVGQLIGDEFNGHLYLVRTPHINQPAFTQNITLRFKRMATH